MRYIRFAPGARSPIPGLVVAVLLLCLPASAGAAQMASVDRSAETLLSRGSGYDSVEGSTRVRQLQRTLRALGHRPGPIDGLYGPLTQGGVERFQAARGLSVDGIVGKNTGRQLRASGRAAAPAENGASSKSNTQARESKGGAERSGSQAASNTGAERSGSQPASNSGAERSGSQPVSSTSSATQEDDNGITSADVPAYLALLGVLATALVAGAVAMWRRRPEAAPDDPLEPVLQQGDAVSPPMVVAGHSSDRRIGRFRGYAQAFLVVDHTKPQPFWVSGHEIERLSRLPAPQPPAPEPDGEDGSDADASAAEQEEETPEKLKALGYASVSAVDRLDGSHFRSQAEAIEQACEVRSLDLLQVVRDIEPQAGSDLKRPGLMYALETIAAGEASCLVVSSLDRLARSSSDLGTLVEWAEQNDGRLVAVDLDLDTGTEAGGIAARALVAAGDLDRRRLAERTRKGLAAARAKGGAGGRPAVSDRPALRERIATMRREGMTLQAIADTLNEEGVPTLRGGAQWRPSSVQAAAGYKRPARNRRLDSLPSATNGHDTGTGSEEGG